MKSIFTITGIVFCSMLYSQTTYTFHTAGNWTDAANWSPSYPGQFIPENSICNINASCVVNQFCSISKNVIWNINSNMTFDNVWFLISSDPPYNSSTTNIASGVTLDFSSNSVLAVYLPGQINNYGSIINVSLSLTPILPGLTINNYGLIDCDQMEGYGNPTFLNGPAFYNFGTYSTAIDITFAGLFINDGVFTNTGISSFANTFTNNGQIVGNGVIDNWLGGATREILNFNSSNNSYFKPGNSPGKIIFDLLPPYSSCFPISIFEAELNGITPETQYDQISVTNCADLSNASLNVTWGFTPTVGQTFDIVTHGSRTGQFSTVNIPPIPGLSFTVDYSDPLKTSIVVSSALPITYSKPLEATHKQNSTMLTWSVATQINNDKYIIEHCQDGRNFSTIGEIDGDGTNYTEHHYEYSHKNPSLGVNYYRIKQIDFDGKYSYSDIASVRYDGSGETSIYPNPAISEVTISTTASTSVQVMDVYGRLLLNRDIFEGQNSINLSALPTGILIFVVGERRFKVLKE